MIDMKNNQNIVIWDNCDPSISVAIQHFEEQWQPYSTASRRYPIIRLIEKVIDPALASYMASLPESYTGYVPGTGVNVSFSEIIRSTGFEAMVRVQRQLLRQFIKTEARQILRDQRFIATLESLIGLVWDCACKRPKKLTRIKGVNLNEQRKHNFCNFCGNLTEFASFMATVADEKINDAELDEHLKLELSHQFCAEHRPKFTNGEWNPAYRRAKRSQAQLNIELDRLNRQCAKRTTPQAASGNPLVDSYFYHYMLRQTMQPADKAELRNLARLMIDLKLSDRKKQILMLQYSGFNQSEISRRLGIGRQAVSKALASTPETFHLRKR